MNEDVENLLQLYVNLYKENHGVKPETNHYRDSFGFAAMLHDYAYVEAEEIIQYFFRTGGEHTTHRLFQNYDELYKAKVRSDKDRDRLEKLRRVTAERVKKWEAEHGD